MDLKSNVVVLGMRRMQGDFEGRAFSWTKIFVEESLGNQNPDVRGKSVIEYRIGDYGRFEEFQHIVFPCQGELVLEQVAAGKGKGSLQFRSFVVTQQSQKKAA